MKGLAWIDQTMGEASLRDRAERVVGVGEWGRRLTIELIFFLRGRNFIG